MERRDKSDIQNLSTQTVDLDIPDTFDLQSLSFRGLIDDLGRLGDAVRALWAEKPKGDR